jgi:hypothetical protein
VSILRLLNGGLYGPEEIEIMVVAYQAALRLSGVTDRTSLTAELMARRLIGIFAAGETDPQKIAADVAANFSPFGEAASRAPKPALQSDHLTWDFSEPDGRLQVFVAFARNSPASN